METMHYAGLEISVCEPIDKGYGLIPNLVGLLITGEALDGSGLRSIHSNLASCLLEHTPDVLAYAKATFARKTAEPEDMARLFEKDEHGRYKHPYRA